MWLAASIWESNIEECFGEWSKNRWGLRRDQAENLEEAFFPCLTFSYLNSSYTEIVLPGYIFIKLKAAAPLPDLSRIPGASGWLPDYPSERPKVIPEANVMEVKAKVEIYRESKLKKIVPGEVFTITKGTYSGLDSIVLGLNDYIVQVRVTLRSKSEKLELPFWFLEKKGDKA